MLMLLIRIIWTCLTLLNGLYQTELNRLDTLLSFFQRITLSSGGNDNRALMVWSIFFKNCEATVLDIPLGLDFDFGLIPCRLFFFFRLFLLFGELTILILKNPPSLKNCKQLKRLHSARKNLISHNQPKQPIPSIVNREMWIKANIKAIIVDSKQNQSNF